MKTITIDLYTIDEHPDKNACFHWVRDNCHHLADRERDEFMDSLNALNQSVGGDLIYSISVVPDRGEYIRLRGYDADTLNSLNGDDLPLTGNYYDKPIIEAAQGNKLLDSLKELHTASEYIYSDEGLKELCEANDYYFTLEGKQVETSL